MLRTATDGDAEAVARVYTEASLAAIGAAAKRDAIAAAASGGHPLWRPLRRPAPEQWMLVHDDADRFGFASFGKTHEKGGHLYALYVAPRAWSTGIGSKLHDAALERCREAGIETVDLWVQEENARARRFYAARGWSVGGEERTNERGTFVRMETQL